MAQNGDADADGDANATRPTCQYAAVREMAPQSGSESRDKTQTHKTLWSPSGALLQISRLTNLI